jgi:hypothetical protein
MLDSCPSILAENIVNIYELWMTGICHAVVAHKDDVNYLGEIASHKGFMQVSREAINISQRFL